jgi:hypothetical protein
MTARARTLLAVPCAVAALALVSAHAQPAAQRTPWGDPDLQGYYANKYEYGFGPGPFDGPEDFTLWERCITRGLPGSMLPGAYGNSYQIVQSPGFVAIRYEMVHDARVIPLDGGPPLPKSLTFDMGDARGRFEGDTLVVETTNFRQRSAYLGANAETLRLTERFTRTSPTTVEWSVTVDDPATWAAPWTFSMPLTRNDSEAIELYECHEGNHAIANILRAARASEGQRAAP